jgi:hypothetical protein
MAERQVIMKRGGPPLASAEYWFARMQEERDRFLKLAFMFGIYTKSDKDVVLAQLEGWACPWATHFEWRGGSSYTRWRIYILGTDHG